MALGGLGAVLGGLSGSSRSSNTIRRITLKIITDDSLHPFHEVTFFKATDQTKGVAPDSILVRSEKRKAEEFNALLVAAIRNTDRNHLQKVEVTETTNVASELKQLWELKELGAITQAEFDSRKTVLIGKHP